MEAQPLRIDEAEDVVEEEVELEMVMHKEGEALQFPENGQPVLYVLREDYVLHDGSSIVEEFAVEVEPLEELPPEPKKVDPPPVITQCPLCGITPRLPDVAKHLIWCKKLLQQYLTIRNTNPKCHKCDICMYAADRSDSLKQHIKRHEPGHKGNPHFIRFQSYEVFSN